jgi:hypothetical protein
MDRSQVSIEYPDGVSLWKDYIGINAIVVEVLLEGDEPFIHDWVPGHGHHSEVLIMAEDMGVFLVYVLSICGFQDIRHGLESCTMISEIKFLEAKYVGLFFG